jgi:hypothetical protein
VSYYLNGKKVMEVEAQKLHGYGMGITNYTNMVLEVDDFIFKHDANINLPKDMLTGLKKENMGNHVNTIYGDIGP